MKKFIQKIKDFVEIRLKGLCERISPEKRVMTIVILFALFALVNFYMIFRAIYDIGREDAGQEIMQIAPIEVPNFTPADTLPNEKVQEMEDFFNQFNSDSYE